MVVNHGDNVRAFVAKQISLRKAKGNRCSLTFDEWTSTRNRRYSNINVHEKVASFWNLGMVRVFGTIPAENCVKLLQQKLQQFELSLKDDIVAICTDGAAVITNVGRVIDAE